MYTCTCIAPYIKYIHVHLFDTISTVMVISSVVHDTHSLVTLLQNTCTCTLYMYMYVAVSVGLSLVSAGFGSGMMDGLTLVLSMRRK